MLFGEVVTARIYLNARSTNAFKKPFVLILEAGFVLGASNFKEAIRFDYKGGGIISKIILTHSIWFTTSFVHYKYKTFYLSTSNLFNTCNCILRLTFQRQELRSLNFSRNKVTLEFEQIFLSILLSMKTGRRHLLQVIWGCVQKQAPNCLGINEIVGNSMNLDFLRSIKSRALHCLLNYLTPSV